MSALRPNRDSVWWLEGDKLTMIARPGNEGWAILCCGIQTPLEPIGSTGLVGIVVRVPRIREALFDIGTQDTAEADRALYRGPDAPAAPAVSEPLLGTIERYAIDSSALDETLRGSIYVPPATAPRSRLPVIYLADGDTEHFAPILESAIQHGRSTPAIIVGMEPGQAPVKGCTIPCDRRALEYLIDPYSKGAQGDNLFARHLRFVTDELIPYVEKHYPASSRRTDRVTAGYSDGAAWALAAAEARPDVFGNVLAMSSVSKAVVAHTDRLKSTRVFAGAGLLEGGTIHQRTQDAAETAKRFGADVEFRDMVAGHSTTMWDILFADGIAWLLPRSH